MLRHYAIIFSVFAVISAKAITLDKVRFHNEASDTTKITNLLAAGTEFSSPQQRIAYVAKQFIGTPYVGGTLDCQPEMLTVNLDEVDCTTFVETVMALAYTIGERRLSWHDFLFNLERLRYRNGEMSDYGSRLHYISDWVVDNVHRGNFAEVTNQLPGCDYIVKTLDFMSRNADKYPQLADSTQLERIKNAEIGYRSHRFPYIKKERIGSKIVSTALREGDIVALTTKIPGLDVSHMGVIVIDNDIPHLLHASSSVGKVVIDKYPLAEYLRRGRNLTGIRVFRLTE